MTAVALVTVSVAWATAILEKLEFLPVAVSGKASLRQSAPSVALFAAALMMSGCANDPPKPPVAAPRVESLAEVMHRAETAAAAGDRDKSREAYRAAAKSEPTSQLPWLKLAESYFDTADYGNAILASQEVLQRDSNDSAAAGILALSGLRVSTNAVAVLRQRNNINASTRGEAETLSRNLRDLLAEPTPTLRMAKEPAALPPARPRVRAVLAPAVAASSAPAIVAKPTATKPASGPAATASSSPFDKLN